MSELENQILKFYQNYDIWLPGGGSAREISSVQASSNHENEMAIKEKMSQTKE
jgi:hypothetical protein